MQQFSRIVARNSAFGMAAQLIIKVLSFGFSVLIVRNLGAETYGQYAAVLAFGAMFVFIADLGLSPYTVREVARLRDMPDGQERIASLYGNVLMLRFLLSLVAAALLIGSAWLTGRPPIMIGAIALGTLGLIMYSVQGSSEAILAGYERLDRVARARVLQQISFVIVGTIVLLLGVGYYGLIMANLLGIALLTYICWTTARLIGPLPSHFSPKLWISLLRASLPFGIIGFTLGLSYKFDSVLLNIFWGDSQTGYYNAAYNLVFSAVMISNVLNTALYPSLARQFVTSSQALPRIYEHAFRYLMIVALPIAVGGWTLADQIVPLLFGQQYHPAIAVLQIIIWVVPLMFATEFLGYIVVIRQQERLVARAVMISTAINVLLNIFMVPTFGLVGAAVMTVVTEFILVSQYLWMLRDTIRQLNWGTVLFRPLLATIIMGALVLVLRQYVPIFVNIPISGLIYAGLLMGLGVFGKDELRFIRGLRKAPEANAMVVADPVKPVKS